MTSPIEELRIRLSTNVCDCDASVYICEQAFRLAEIYRKLGAELTANHEWCAGSFEAGLDWMDRKAQKRLREGGGK